MLTGEDRLNAFYELSATLTGFDRFDLVGTGLGPTYFAKVVQQVSETTLNALLGRWNSIRKEYAQTDQEAVLATEVRHAPELGATARQIIMLWYTGSWYTADASASNVVSSAAYVEGLMWQAIDSHPMAAKPLGFGAWALPPAKRL